MKKRSAPEIFGMSINTIILFLLAFSTTYPFWHVMMYSISDSRAAMSGGLFFIPREPTLLAYQMLFKTRLIFIVYRNTIIRTVAGTILSLLVSALTAYPLSLNRFKGRSFFAMMIFFTMLFSGGMIPTYLVVRNLGLLDTLWALILPGAMSAYNMFILRNYFKSIPDSLEESALLDGANPLQVLFLIILPLSAPALAAIAMFYGVGNWNSYLDGVLYINSTDRQILQVYLRTMLGTAGAKGVLGDISGNLSDASSLTEETMKMVTITVSIIPVLIVYPFLQKYYTKGILIGSVKG
jgi:putative aldouronate transport system permease protein